MTIPRAGPCLAVVMTGLAACSASPVEDKHQAAEFACLKRSFVAQGIAQFGPHGELHAGEDMGMPEVVESDSTGPSFSTTSTGQFTTDFGTVLLKEPYRSYRLRCTGDLNAGTLTGLQIDGRMMRPPRDKSWTF